MTATRSTTSPPLTSQTELRLLLLANNAIKDLTPLVELVQADAGDAKRIAPFLRVYLAGNPLSDEAKSSQIEALKAARGRRVEHLRRTPPRSPAVGHRGGPRGVA